MPDWVLFQSLHSKEGFMQRDDAAQLDATQPVETPETSTLAGEGGAAAIDAAAGALQLAAGVAPP